MTNTAAQEQARNLVADRVAGICGSEAGDDEVNAVIDRFGYSLDGVSDRDVWDAATGGAEWPHG